MDRLGEDVGDREHRDALRLPEGIDRHGVRDDDAVERTLLDPLDRRRREDAVSRARVDLLRAALLQELRARDERACGVDHVVRHNGALAVDVADDVRDVRDVVRRPVLLEDG